jgi:hypothetical protein
MLKLTFAGFAVIATAAIAQAPSDTPGRRVTSSQDPNEMVCVSERLPDSVFMKRRVCRTRAEWAEHRAQSRQTIERVQTYKPGK